ncbi:MAG: (2Fe-2S) ferredoxin domain-containing protein [Pseudomonadota bacterium]
MSRPVRLIVCVNERLGTGQRSCVGSGSLDYIQILREEMAHQCPDIKIVERECLGKCEEGPVMRIAPGGRFFTGIKEDDLPQIIEALKTFARNHVG